ncbi:MAG: preprotein translocase subunit SecY [SAR324 cluster bacterium]|uniref:Protein translocase subunit SecY n=1 Tax=SAR324 cluster bacterium TaxID=2024889 RepID=A0A2A4TAI2_9DELT|nr:MAG: preprotein translocase subunit SecY [SAR324 cluster bacterium]
MIDVFKNIVKIEELRKRILYTLMMLIVFRIGAHIPIPGIDSKALASFFNANSSGLLGHLDMFSGGALRNMTIFALGIMPYISASIIMQLLTAVFPVLERLSREGEAGRKKITQYTRYGTIVLGIIQGFGIAVGLESMGGLDGSKVVLAGMNTWAFRFTTVVTLTAGTAFIMWVGEQISERGIGNGISLIIFAGIITGIPSAIVQTIALMDTGDITLFVILLVGIIIVGVIGVVIYFETANRKIPVQYARRTQGKKTFGGQFSHLPLKINASGVIPPIFASSILAFPATITGFTTIGWVQDIGNNLVPGRLLYNVVFVILIFFFCFFYTAIQYNPMKIAEEMKRYGGFIPGIRPGKKTADYLNLVLTRLTFGGAFYLSLICVLPSILYVYFKVPFSFGGTAVLIVVGVALDTILQVETFLLNQNYDGFIRKSKKRKRHY